MRSSKYSLLTPLGDTASRASRRLGSSPPSLRQIIVAECFASYSLIFCACQDSNITCSVQVSHLADSIWENLFEILVTSKAVCSFAASSKTRCARARTRTWDHGGISSALYQLSYARNYITYKLLSYNIAKIIFWKPLKNRREIASTVVF